jgi:hypothetical protein
MVFGRRDREQRIGAVAQLGEASPVGKSAT